MSIVDIKVNKEKLHPKCVKVVLNSHGVVELDRKNELLVTHHLESLSNDSTLYQKEPSYNQPTPGTPVPPCPVKAVIPPSTVVMDSHKFDKVIDHLKSKARSGGGEMYKLLEMIEAAVIKE